MQIKDALIIVDVQNDFMKNGPLEVPDAEAIVPIINTIQNRFHLIVATQDWHPANHKSFASNHINKKPFEKIMLHDIEQVLWPDHCIQGTMGAEFHPKLETKPIQAIFRKGMHVEIDSYSGFYDNDHQNSTGLAGFLHDKEAVNLYFCGLCADVCVYFSIKDALLEGFNCWLIEDATRPLNKDHFKNIKQQLKRQGVNMISSSTISKN